MAASNTFMIVHGLAPCQAMLDRILALHSRLSSCLLGMAAPSLPPRGENFGWFGGMGGQDGGRVREENEERQNRGCVGGIGAWGQIVTGRQSRKGKGDKKGLRDRENQRGTHRGEGSSLWAHAARYLPSPEPLTSPCTRLFSALCPVPDHKLLVARTAFVPQSLVSGSMQRKTCVNGRNVRWERSRVTQGSPRGMESWGDGETSVEQGQGGGKRDQKLVIER